MNWKKYLNADRLRPSTRDTELDSRNEFESDFGRVIFSPATRRMHDKTQVFPLTTDDNIHSRLTHSMEVMSIGHSLGLNICNDRKFLTSLGLNDQYAFREIPVVLKNACLVHDIGNPPFGHFGETVIKHYFTNLFANREFDLDETQKQDFTLFDGNAQGLRVLSKLQVLEDVYGLNLTYATLATYLKYPNAGAINSDIFYLKKRGVFQSEKEYLDKIAAGCELSKGNSYKRHPLSYLMEAADSICYLVMDIEDGFNKGLFTYDKVIDLLKTVSGIEEQANYLKRFEQDLTRVVNLRIYLIKRLVDLAVRNFKTHIVKICEGDYNEELIKDDESQIAKKLFKFCKSEIFSNKEVQSLELTGHSVLTGLLDYYINFCFHENEDYRKRAIGLISKGIIRIACMETNTQNFEDLNHYYKLRVIVDYISGMTDQYALNQFQKLSGQKIS